MGTQGQDLTLLDGEPFAWGQTDCVCIVSQWIDAVFKTDVARLALGQYKDEEGALAQQRIVPPVETLKSLGFTLFCAPPPCSGDVLLGRSGPHTSMAFLWRERIWTSNKVLGVFSVPVSRAYLLNKDYILCRQQHLL